MKKTTTTNSAELAAVNFETSNFSFKIKDDYLHVVYDCKSLETWNTFRSIKSYGILDAEKTKFWIEQIQVLYEDVPESKTVWMGLKKLTSNNVLTAPLMN